MKQPGYVQDIGHLYADLSGVLMAIKNLLAAKGIATPEEFREAFQERLLTLQGDKHQHPYMLLKMASKISDQSDL